jgi:hypothetical protein
MYRTKRTQISPGSVKLGEGSVTLLERRLLILEVSCSWNDTFPVINPGETGTRISSKPVVVFLRRSWCVCSMLILTELKPRHCSKIRGDGISPDAIPTEEPFRHTSTGRDDGVPL